MTDNRRLLDRLIGEWDTRGSHPKIKEPITGHASFEWLAGHKFLIWRTENTPALVPTSISILGDVTAEEFPMNYFDSRGVARVYTVRIAGGVLRFWRDEPGFRQRATVSFEGAELRWHTELNEDGSFRPDLEMAYRR